MLSEQRIFHFQGELNISRSKGPDAPVTPANDTVNWLFMKVGERQFSFVYKIIDLENAKYGHPFKIDMAFTMIEEVSLIVLLDQAYQVYRGRERIGSVTLMRILP